MYYPGDTIHLKQSPVLTKGSDTFSCWLPQDGSGATMVGVSGYQYLMGDKDVVFSAQYSGIYVHADAMALPKPSTTVKNTDYNNGIILGNNMTKNKVSSITFLDSILIPDGAVVWNAADDNSNGVVGWAVLNADNRYDVVYASDGVFPSFPDDISYLFGTSQTNISSGFTLLTEINNLDKIDLTSIKSMSYFVSGCESLCYIDVSNFDTSNVSSMACMFYKCNSLITLDVSNLDTSKVTDMSSTFFGCSSLTSLDVSSFDTSNVTNMSSMFRACRGLSTLDVSNFDTSNVCYMYDMFFECYNIEDLDANRLLNGMILSRQIEGLMFEVNLSRMFEGCSKLQLSLDIDSWDLNICSNKLYGENFSRMFSGCKNLQHIKLTNIKLAGNSDLGCMFYGINSPKCIVSLENWTSTIGRSKSFGRFDYMFSNSIISEVNITNVNASNISSMKSMFGYKLMSTDFTVNQYTSIGSINFTNFNTCNVEDMSYMFEHATCGSAIDFSKIDVSSVTSMDGLFHSCELGFKLVINGWDLSRLQSDFKHDRYSVPFYDSSFVKFEFSNITYSEESDLSGFFELACYSDSPKISSIILTDWKFKRISNDNTLARFDDFLANSKASNINIINFDGSGIGYATRMFAYNSGLGDDKLTSLNLDGISLDNLLEAEEMFTGCGDLFELDLSNLNFHNVTSFYRMFQGCRSLVSLKLSTLDSAKTGPFSYMFKDCISLTTLDLSSFDTSNVTSMRSMFENCSNLESLDLTFFNTSNVTNMSRMFYGCNKLTSLDLGTFDTSKVTSFTDMFTECFVQDANSKLYYRSADELSRYKASAGLSESITTVLRPKDAPASQTTVISQSSEESAQDITYETQDDFINENDNETEELVPSDDKASEESGLDEDEHDSPDISSDQGDLRNVAYADELEPSGNSAEQQDEGNSGNVSSSVPDSYKQTVDGGSIEWAPMEISYSLDAMNFGQYGTSGMIAVECNIPDGLTFVANSFEFQKIPNRIKGDTGNVNGKMVEEPSYNAQSKTITFKVNGLSAGAYMRVLFKCKLESMPADYTQYVLNANYTTSAGVTATSNNVVHHAESDLRRSFLQVMSKTVISQRQHQIYQKRFSLLREQP